jgi:hypothetical protein
MTGKASRKIFDVIQEGLEETALLTALGYQASQGRPGRYLLNNELERLGYGRPIDEQEPDKLQPYLLYPDEWIRAIARAVSGRSDAPLPEVIAILKQKTADRPS